MFKSPDYRHKCHAPFKCAPTVLCTYDDLIFLNCYSLFHNLLDFSLQLNLSDTEILLMKNMKNVLTYRNVLHPNLETSGTGYWDRL